MTELRLILGDQLHAGHSWYREVDDEVLYVIAELHQETGYVKHHVQKICAFFAAMAAFAEALENAGHRVLHLTLDDTAGFADLPALLAYLCAEHGCSRLRYQRPDERRLLAQLRGLHMPGISISEVDSEHFLLPFDVIADWFEAGKHQRMETFYRKMRREQEVLMQDGKPEGGKWNYDQANRNAFRAADLAQIPEPLCFANDVGTILERLERHGIDHFGQADTRLLWPVTRQQSLQLLDFFCTNLLPRFGTFQDAMTGNSPHAWSLYHSRLSFALNSKMLTPRLVIDSAIAQYQQAQQQGGQAISLAQVEGFVRQILGWREYVRGMYWVNSNDYDRMNALQATAPLPKWFWTGETRMRCLSQAIGQSLQTGYAHHIQRLMLTGNFALLAGLDPDQVEAWYLGIYVDAIEWVEQPNTRSMALFADGGWVATKPYAASANYINKMSDYCGDCAYSHKDKTGANACPFNALYWHFLYRHDERLGRNPRMGFPYKAWYTKAPEEQQALLKRADWLLAHLNEL